MMTQRVYDGRQYANTTELWNAIDRAVMDINVSCRDQLNALFASIPKLILEYIDLKEALTHY